MSLREDLKRRLAEVRTAALPDPMEHGLNARAFLVVNDAVADECLRQMEWAYRKGERDEAVSESAVGGYDTIGITLAPEGWTP